MKLQDDGMNCDDVDLMCVCMCARMCVLVILECCADLATQRQQVHFSLSQLPLASCSISTQNNTAKNKVMLNTIIKYEISAYFTSPEPSSEQTCLSRLRSICNHAKIDVSDLGDRCSAPKLTILQVFYEL